MDQISGGGASAPDGAAQSEHRRVFEAWQQKNQELEALWAGRWTQVAAVVLPFGVIALIGLWLFEAH